VRRRPHPLQGLFARRLEQAPDPPHVAEADNRWGEVEDALRVEQAKQDRARDREQ
jgi:hypothetical protein